MTDGCREPVFLPVLNGVKTRPDLGCRLILLMTLDSARSPIYFLAQHTRLV
ncbi:hypothetical protein NDI51_11600 [Microcoleus vaginatus GB1-A3]